MDPKVWQWQRQIGDKTYLISTSKTLLPRSFVDSVFAHPDVFWTQPLPEATLTTLLENSCTLALYSVSATDASLTPIGMGRLVTDYVTLAYLTDVFLAEDARGKGLGKWLVQCAREVALGMPALRFMLLLTGSEEAERMYERELGMKGFGGGDGAHKLVAMGARRADLERVADETGEAKQGSS